MAGTLSFRPATPSGWVTWCVQVGSSVDLAWRNRLRLERRDLETLRRVPPDAGVVLVANHADETDVKVCLELARRCHRRFLFMVNREAFDEGWGWAGWWLQRLGAFSVERGGRDEAAKRYAIDAVKRGADAVVIFPEGEIFYLNDLVQPFKSGAVDIGLQAVLEARRNRSDWTAYLVPLAIKYRYRQPVGPILERRIGWMEQRLFKHISRYASQRKLALIMAELLHRAELAHDLPPTPHRLTALSERVRGVRQAVLSQIEAKYAHPAAGSTAPVADRSRRLSFYLRSQLAKGRLFSAETRAQLRQDVAELKRISQMGGWQPHYVDLDPSQERLAETVLKLEREVYRVKRPRQLANRDVFLRVGEPIDIGPLIPVYQQEPQTVRHRLAEQLRDTIQALINTIVPPTGRAAGSPEAR
ncbi:MAG: 1-acyl-sn-glycerol-3-phosphate acyltransferase [Candidatus Omnitrophica bacterium]|nr:1-acyl-sn-glycerol-3-phosphate acyltransferase [Candidatus Omnitrophota bacterium]